MRTTTRIPARNQPDGRRFGTDPDTRPPMHPRDAYISIIMVGVSAVAAVSLVSGVVSLAMYIDEVAAQAISAGDAKRSTEGGAK